MVFFGSMMKTLRMVKAMPFSSTLVASWWSILQDHNSVLCYKGTGRLSASLTCRRQERPCAPCHR